MNPRRRSASSSRGAAPSSSKCAAHIRAKLPRSSGHNGGSDWPSTSDPRAASASAASAAAKPSAATRSAISTSGPVAARIPGTPRTPSRSASASIGNRAGISSPLVIDRSRRTTAAARSPAFAVRASHRVVLRTTSFTSRAPRREVNRSCRGPCERADTCSVAATTNASTSRRRSPPTRSTSIRSASETTPAASASKPSETSGARASRTASRLSIRVASMTQFNPDPPTFRPRKGPETRSLATLSASVTNP